MNIDQNPFKIQARLSQARGVTQNDELKSEHTFSFGDYFDPYQMGCRCLRVMNEDWMQPESGFQTHAHQNMEMIALVLEGELQHRDSLGYQKWIRSGEIRRMSAGTGMTYSEGNSSKTEVLHLIQIWVHPSEFELEPSYEQKSTLSCSSSGLLRLIASPDPDSGGVKIHQDVLIYLGDFQCGEKVEFKVREGRFVWIQVIRGSIAIPGMNLMSGDGGSIEGVGILEIVALDSSQGSQILLFDLP